MDIFFALGGGKAALVVEETEIATVSEIIILINPHVRKNIRRHSFGQKSVLFFDNIGNPGQIQTVYELIDFTRLFVKQEGKDSSVDNTLFIRLVDCLYFHIVLFASYLVVTGSVNLDVFAIKLLSVLHLDSTETNSTAVFRFTHYFNEIVLIVE